MGFFRNLRERFKGREFWRTINNTLIVVIYTTLILGAILFRQYLYIVFVALGMIVPSYVAFFINHLRNMEQQDKGHEVFGGWVEHRHGKGELKYFYPEEIVPYERLSEIDQTSVDDFMEFIAKLTKERIKISLEAKKAEELGEPKEPLKLLTYEEREKEEKEELEDLKEEFEKTYEEEHDLGETLSDEDLRELYEKDTGKNVEWQGKITKGYLEWKKERLGECEDG